MKALNVLNRNSYFWDVYQRHSVLRDSVWPSHGEATSRCMYMNNRSTGGYDIRQIELWQGNDGKYYEVSLTSVPVGVTKEIALAKLSDDEREVLGL